MNTNKTNRIEKYIELCTDRFTAQSIVDQLRDPENGIHAQMIECSHPLTGEPNSNYFDVRVVFNKS